MAEELRELLLLPALVQGETLVSWLPSPSS